MNYRERIYMLLASGETMSTSAIAVRTGLPLGVVQETIFAMVRDGLLKKQPVLYSITPKGSLSVKRKQSQGKLPVIARKEAQPRGLVSTALSRRHALDQCWGARA